MTTYSVSSRTMTQCRGSPSSIIFWTALLEFVKKAWLESFSDNDFHLCKEYYPFRIHHFTEFPVTLGRIATSEIIPALPLQWQLLSCFSAPRRSRRRIRVISSLENHFPHNFRTTEKILARSVNMSTLMGGDLSSLTISNSCSGSEWFLRIFLSLMRGILYSRCYR